MKLVDDTVRQVHERYWQTEAAAATGKTVVLVEGDDDRDVLEELLKRRRPTWQTKVRVTAAGGRAQVLRARPRFHSPHIHAPHMLVDRDTWTDDEIKKEQSEEPDLLVTAGWCLENLFLDPEFLRAFDRRVADELDLAREAWVRAGALWWTLQRARDAQQRWWEEFGWSGYGAPREGSNPASASELLAALPSAGVAVIEGLAEDFEERLRLVSALSEADQWRLGVHGKSAFRRALVPSLQRHCLARASRIELARSLPWPPPHPLDGLVAMLFP